MKHLLLAAAVAVFALPAHAQADRCAMFQPGAIRSRCLNDLLQSPPADPYCLPMSADEMRAVRAGRRVRVPGIGGCEWVWN